jgi:hypothetical protein
VFLHGRAERKTAVSGPGRSRLELRGFLWDEYGGTDYALLCRVELLDYDQRPANRRGPRPTTA